MQSQKELLIEWTRQCFQAAGLETSDKEVRKFAATAANEVINDGYMGFAEGKFCASRIGLQFGCRRNLSSGVHRLSQSVGTPKRGEAT